jgi:PAS domain S-box-containing protein
MECGNEKLTIPDIPSQYTGWSPDHHFPPCLTGPNAGGGHDFRCYPTEFGSEIFLLQQVRKEYKSRLAHYTGLYDGAPVGYLTLTHDGIVQEANLKGADLFGTDCKALIGRFLAEFISTEMQDAFHDFLKQIFDSRGKATREILFLNAEKRPFFAHVEANVDKSGHICRMALCDISERKQAELNLVESEERFRLMADSAPVLIWIADPNQQYQWFNQMWLDFTGTTLEQELGIGWIHGVHPDDIQVCMGIQNVAFKTHRPFSLEYRLRRHDGQYHDMLVHAAPRTAPSGRFLGYIGSCTDISERKKMEEALQHSRQMLRHLVSYQERVREDERKRIAREIHDDLGQNLLALRIDISMLHMRTSDAHPKLHECVGVALNHIDATMKAVRAAINNLRPTVLDLGLNAAIEWQVQDFQRRSGIICKLVVGADFMLDDNRATALFRILQESLNNVIRHAQANQVRIDLYRDGEILIMKVEDNGIGIYPDCRRKANSFGLIGIQERINALGGTLEIDSGEDKGTRLMVFLPMQSS